MHTRATRRADEVQIIEEAQGELEGDVTTLFEEEDDQLERVRSANRSAIQAAQGEVERDDVRVSISDAYRFVAIRRLMEWLNGREAGSGLQGELDEIVGSYIGPSSGKRAWPPTPIQRRRVAEIVVKKVRDRTGRDYHLEGVRYLSGSRVEGAVLYRPNVKSKHMAVYEVKEKKGQGSVRMPRLHRMTQQSVLWRRDDGGAVRGLVELEDWSDSKTSDNSFPIPFELLTAACARERVACVLESIGKEQPRRMPRSFVLLNVRWREAYMDTDALRAAWKRVPVEHMPVPSEAAIRRVCKMAKILRELPRGSVRALDNMFEGKRRGHINETIKAMQWMCACRADTIYAPGNVLMMNARYVGPMIQPPVLMRP